jgi:sugar/nucleoside kinase (ribokinase family)
VKSDLRWQYTTVGHVCADVLEDGSRQAGGAAFYSALQAARLGLSARILTRGVASEIEALLEPFAGELELEVEAATHTTTLHTVGSGRERTQRVLAWAGPISQQLEIDSSILHLAPIARETPARWRGNARFVGLTPQGLVRGWSGPEQQIALVAPPQEAEDVAGRCHALVVSEHERNCCSALIARAGAASAVVAITDGGEPNTLLAPGQRPRSLAVPPLSAAVDDLGAGDVFAAAFFVALSEGRSPTAAMDFANAAAAVRMGSLGASAIGDRDTILARMGAVAPA